MLKVTPLSIGNGGSPKWMNIIDKGTAISNTPVSQLCRSGETLPRLGSEEIQILTPGSICKQLINVYKKIAMTASSSQAFTVQDWSPTEIAYKDQPLCCTKTAIVVGVSIPVSTFQLIPVTNVSTCVCPALIRLWFLVRVLWPSCVEEGNCESYLGGWLW